MSNHLVLYAGSFDPITLGHLDVIQRARIMFDTIVVGVGNNANKAHYFQAEERVEMAKNVIENSKKIHEKGLPLGSVIVEPYEGLTVDYAKKIGAIALLRGIRNISDLAYETQLAVTNRQVADIETAFVVAGSSFAFTSSSLIRQVVELGGDPERLNEIVPSFVIDRLKTRQKIDK